jgi:2-oxoisovalerate dehydrogenase E2 component (dihydrolipoyl transacylase)
MSRQLLLPELAESVVEGEILKWLVQEGERVELEQPICEVMTDKVTVELPSPYAGILEKQLVPEGGVVAVHGAIALISEESLVSRGEETSPVSSVDSVAGAEPAADPDTSLFKVENHQEELKVSGLNRSMLPKNELHRTPVLGMSSAVDDATPLLGVNSAPGDATPLVSQPPVLTSPLTTEPEHPSRPQVERVLAVPAARQLARTLGLDIAAVSGSGPNGRIRPLDVQQHAQQQGRTTQEAVEPPPAQSESVQSKSAHATAEASAAESAVPSKGSGLNVSPVQYRTPRGYEHLEQRMPLRGMRRAIAGQMQASHLYTVRTLTVDEANLSALVGLRSRLNAQLAPDGVKLSYMPFIFKAVVAALKNHPSLNTSLDEATGEIVQKGYYHLGMAVTTDAGLTVPVIRDADHRSLLQLGQAVNELAEKARSNKLTPDELAGSSFSVTNIGSVGALFSFPIINVPDAAILGVHSIVKRPIVDAAGQIVAADMMYLSLSFDHRLVDGAEAARFCKAVIRLLENPELLMASI